jgi:type III restriction enzyme
VKFHFERNQQYQHDAIWSVVDIFAAQQEQGSVLLEISDSTRQLGIEVASAQGNILNITSEQIIKNVHAVQERHALPKSEIFSGISSSTSMYFGQYLNNGMNFSIEMETGTGKTYVYLRTIHELHKNYGWKKFIIVVPSVAIREGVLKNLEITKEHFADLYNNPEMNYYVWDSKKTGQAREFATNDTLQIMVITIDSFAKAQNIMNKESDYGRPLDFIKATNPIVIMDEPQNMETPVRKAAIESLNPLCTLRYSATHKEKYNLLYRLTPVDAYDKGLVKKIEVHSVQGEDSYNDAYIAVQSIERAGKSRLFAKLELDISDERGLQRKIVKVAPGDDLARLTKRSIYEGYVIERIDHSEQAVEFGNGKVLYVGQRDESLHEDIVKRQIELTIEDHFEKQKKLGSDVKVLSLFFIDKVANYREYTDGGFVKGKFAKWFEEAYVKTATKPKYADVMEGLQVEDVHNGYFAADKNGHWKDSKDTKGEGGRTKDDDGAYSLIMKDKERLLDVNEPLRFIFSHSALREGWDNPNVFQICTLNETSSQMKKRQEIGRGLRLPVNVRGERVRDENINILTVIANESYADFSRKLQNEIEEETGVSFPGRVKNRTNRQKISFRKSVTLDPAFKELWEKIKHKTTYRVNIDTERLITEVVRDLENVTITRPQIIESKTALEKMGDGQFESKETGFNARAANIGAVRVPNLLEAIQNRTLMTRQLIFDILDSAKMFDRVPDNPQQVIDEVCRAINRVKNRLAVDGIKYEKTGEVYNMELFENPELERYLYDAALSNGAIKSETPERTVYDYVEVDSEIEHDFMKSLEDNDDIKFYIKLPGWFKIDTPVGAYNPDWAIVFDDDECVYFVAETKGDDDVFADHIQGSQERKIKAAEQHFEILSTPYVAPVNSLRSALAKLQNRQG